jgi:hypothetical protein
LSEVWLLNFLRPCLACPGFVALWWLYRQRPVWRMQGLNSSAATQTGTQMENMFLRLGYFWIDICSNPASVLGTGMRGRTLPNLSLPQATWNLWHDEAVQMPQLRALS